VDIESSNYTKLSSSEYIVGDDIVTDYQGDIMLITEDYIRFFNIEFDAKMILSLNQFKCINDENEIYNFIGKYKDDTTYSSKIQDIKMFEFSQCKFKEDVYFNMSDNCIITIESCIFEKNFNINKSTHSQQKTDKDIKINRLEIDSCIFKKNFLIERCFIINYRFINIIFEGEAKLFYIVFETMFKNTKDEEDAWFTNTVFNKSAIFEEIIFKEFIRFQHTSFKGYTLFRDVRFENGLDLDYTNIEKVINFYNLQGLDTKSSKNITSQETYRVIKYNFEKIGNKIEANKYHTLELNSKRQNIWKSKTSWLQKIQNIFIYYTHWISSNHSQSWLLALIWIFIVSTLTSLFIEFETVKALYNYTLNHFKQDYIAIYKGWHSIYKFKYLSIFAGIDIDKNSLTFLFHKIFLGYLYYQFLVAIRKDTKK